jgi:ribosomal protein L30E
MDTLGEEVSVLRDRLQRTNIYQFDAKEEEYRIKLNKLKFAAKCGSVCKGLKETIRAIKSNKAKSVYLASDCVQVDYKKLIVDLCELYKVEFFEMKDWLEIRDNVMDCIPSHILIEKARKNGSRAKITPKCHVAAILRYGDIDRKVQENRK